MSTSRLRTYIPLIQKFSARQILFHAAVASSLGLNTTDLAALRLLGDTSLSASELGTQLGLTGAAMTALVDRLEKAGYVERERSTVDRRRVAIHALPKRLREIESLYLGQGARMQTLLSNYSAEEFRVVTDFLERTTDVLTQE